MEFRREYVTKEKARKYLEANSLNRPLRPAVKDSYIRDMESGLWMETGAERGKHHDDH